MFRPKKKKKKKKSYVSDFPTDCQKMRWLIFSHEEKNLIRERPRTIPVFIYIRYIICSYQFLDIVGLNHSFIYFHYGCTLTSQTEHISAVYFEACSHISA